MAPSCHSRVAISGSPRCAGISTMRGVSLGAGAGVRIRQVSTAPSPRTTRMAKVRNRTFLRVYTTPPSGPARSVPLYRSVILARRGAPRPEFAQGVSMLELELPTQHDWKVTDNTYGKLVIESFEPGLALTVGNAYRRVLLSAIHGAAPTWVKIENVLHEFSHLPGVMEDTLDILMNLRKAVFRLHLNRPKILRLKAQGVGVAKAGDFEPDADVEILTPDVPLATLDKDGMLEMEVCIERGRGYVPAERREPEALPINAILLDADFSPVKRVNFHVETVGSERERLVLELWTDGSVTPGMAVSEASRILDDHFELLRA